jgi:hypothetical protein
MLLEGLSSPLPHRPAKLQPRNGFKTERVTGIRDTQCGLTKTNFDGDLRSGVSAGLSCGQAISRGTFRRSGGFLL